VCARARVLEKIHVVELEDKGKDLKFKHKFVVTVGRHERREKIFVYA